LFGHLGGCKRGYFLVVELVVMLFDDGRNGLVHVTLRIGVTVAFILKIDISERVPEDIA
jgi:hypothetical protein